MRLIAGLWLAAALFLALVLYAAAADQPKPHGMKIEVRYCQPIGDSDEADDAVTCSCKVSDWITDGDAKILVCEH